VTIDTVTPDTIGIATKSIDTVDIKFLDANNNKVLGDQSRRPTPPQTQSIFPRDLAGNILRDSTGKIVEIILNSISRDRIELQIPSELGRVSQARQFTLFVLRDPGAGSGFKVGPTQVTGVGLICHFERH
jgi:spore coat protein CotH